MRKLLVYSLGKEEEIYKGPLDEIDDDIRELEFSSFEVVNNELVINVD